MRIKIKIPIFLINFKFIFKNQDENRNSYFLRNLKTFFELGMRIKLIYNGHLSLHSRKKLENELGNLELMLSCTKFL